MQEQLICPYPGLRPFNEDEAIFFKGREEHIEQIVKQLEEKKFLMLTGASGDGKSSLVYAGLIPNARAGFFKAKFNNWVVADFRPERDPLTNMAIAINQQLKINDSLKVEKELSYGFSALIDLYKSSPFWIDQQSEPFKLLSADEQKKAKRKGANLLILVDQFEEFFTNPENYTNGKTSLESQAVVNLLLETTRIAIEQDIPVYIICTMRSDYIGQCASFRGLPEYIGYSQFFVPRLKRQEIYQVIEEPALLNGNKISKRLVEMLINEMNDGIDQLPVLQHALNQIWQKADKGMVEMDLIHFAKINGIPKNQLTVKDREAFEIWFDTLPEFKKVFFANSSLGDVLDAHANELYETADSVSKTISKQDAKLIVETTFKCLTKIDEARAVRNRMTLDEVVQIINQEHITLSVVEKVLEIFRKQGNTFLKPFIFEDENSHDLKENSVLDITHESLIRNWNLLSNWASEEHENFLSWQDFNKQLQRWTSNNKSSGFLLPIGPLTFFETWFNSAKPNKHWLARYDERELSKEQKLAEAEMTLANAKQFIKRSARRLFFSRTVLKYGADKLIAVFGLLLLIFSCTYFYFDFRKKQNDYVIQDIQKKGNELLKSKYIKNKVKADYILTAERLNPGVFKDLLNQIESDSSKNIIVAEIFSKCIDYQENKKDNEQDNPLLGELYKYQLNRLTMDSVFSSNTLFVKNMNSILSLVYGNMVLQGCGYQKKHALEYEKLYQNCFNGFIKLLDDTSVVRKIEISRFNILLQTMPIITNADSVKIGQIIERVNPFNKESLFNKIYSKEKEVDQSWNNKITHNGGYYQLACLFALNNDFESLNKSYDSLLKYNKSFLNQSYYGYCYKNIIMNLMINGSLFSDNAKKFVNKIELGFKEKTAFSPIFNLLNDLCDEKQSVARYAISDLYSTVIRAFGFNFQKYLISYTALNTACDNYVAEIYKSSHNSNKGGYVDEYTAESERNNLKTSNEKNYQVALIYKAKALSNNKKQNYNESMIYKNLDLAFLYFNKIDKAYLKEYIDVRLNDEKNFFQRGRAFIYPCITHFEDWKNFREWQIKDYKDRTAFLDYTVSKFNYHSIYFMSDDDAETLNLFLINYFSTIDWNDSTQTLLSPGPFLHFLKDNTLHKKIDKDALLAYLTLYYKNTKEASKYAKQINFKTFLNKEKIAKNSNIDNYYDLAKSLLNYYFTQPFSQSFNEDGLVSKKETQGYDSAFALLNSFQDGFQKRNALIINIDSLQRGKKDAMAISLLDTLLNSYVAKSSKYGNKLFEIFGRLSTSHGDKMAMALMKDKSDKTKPDCLNFFIDGKAQSGNYYQATTFIPEYISSSSELTLYTTILKSEVIKRKTKPYDGWSAMDKNYDRSWMNSPYEEGNNDIIYSVSED